jgi:leucyl aminopeptidase
MTDTGSPSKKLSKDELEQVAHRLHDMQMERKYQNEQKRKDQLEKGMFKQAPLTKESADGLVNRVYTSQIEKKKRQEEQKKRDLEASATSTKTLSESETADMVQRMYYQQQERANRSREALQTKYQPPADNKKLDKVQQDDVGNRLCRGVHEKKQEVRKKLFDKYIAPMEPERKTITKEQLKASAERLSSKK